MVDILLYSGSFNPIHKGHTTIAEYLLKGGFCKELWLVISPHNPFKLQEDLIEAEHRLNMARIATENLRKGIVVSDIELSMPQPSYTINTVDKLIARYPGKKIGLLIGSDNLDDLSKWKDIQRLKSICTMFVYPRTQADKITNCPEDFILLSEALLVEISSTEIRKSLSSNEKTSELIDPEVLEYIQENHLWAKNNKKIN